MKIFNWVHKRFHHTALKDSEGFASNVKTVGPAASGILSNADRQGLMKQVALSDDDLLGGWKEGILTIGTLGCDPLLNPFNRNKQQYVALESEDDDEDRQHDKDKDEAEDEEVNPLMHTTFEHNFDKVLVVVVSDGNHVAHANNKLEKAESVDEIENNNNNKNKIGERITLADLFLADSDVKMKIDPVTKRLLHHSSEKKTSTTTLVKDETIVKAKHGLSFTNKLIPRVKDNPHPIKDFKKLMKKMLKKKIHPELDVKNHKTSDEDDHKHEANEDTASLLPI